MELRVLRYFVTVAKENSFSRAAQVLNISQPALSKQIKDLEDEYNIILFDRTTRSLSLTPQGYLFLEQAKSILGLVDKTEALFKEDASDYVGNIYLGCSESQCNRIVMKAMAKTQEKYPKIRFHVTSGHAKFVMDQLDQDAFDIGIVVDPVVLTKYSFIKLPYYDTRGILMRRDSPLAAYNEITPSLLKDKPLIISNHELVRNEISGWLGIGQEDMNIVATYSLFYNARLMVEENMGYVLTLDNLYNYTQDSPVCFRPLSPQLTIRSNVIWKKNKVFPKIVQLFLDILQEETENAMKNE